MFLVEGGAVLVLPSPPRPKKDLQGKLKGLSLGLDIWNAGCKRNGFTHGFPNSNPVVSIRNNFFRVSHVPAGGG